MKKSFEYYNQIASDYEQIRQKRINYINSVDDIITGFCSNNDLSIKKYLDIGTGDGVRATKIANKIAVDRTFFLDDSKELLNKIPSNIKATIVSESILNYDTDLKFDLITCLWNVLGHIEPFQNRESFFVKIKQLISDKGYFIIDVNNRYNIEEYGYKNVMKNMQLDILKLSDSGIYELGSKENRTNVYIHAPNEIEKHCRKVGLKVYKLFYVNYRTGDIKTTFFEGQLLYIICNE